MQRYNAGVTLRPSRLLLFAATVLALASVACNRAPENKDAVREGLIDHLSKNTGLDLKSMDVDVTNVNFQGNQATATVSFKPKSSPDSGMSMNYTLERNGTKWVVQRAAGSAGHGSAIDGASPQTSAPNPGAHAPGAAPPPVVGGDGLPPGHPPVAPNAGSQKGGETQLPSGHPPISGQAGAPKTK